MGRRLSTIAILFLFVGLTSCVDVKYPEPQPNFKWKKCSFPKKLRGSYLNEDGKTAVTVTKFEAKLEGDKEFTSIVDLKSDTAILKKWRGVWFVNIKESDSKYWNAAFVEFKDDNLFLSYMDESTEILEQITKVKRAEDPKGDVIINPERKEWKKIFEQMEFTTTEYYKN